MHCFQMVAANELLRQTCGKCEEFNSWRPAWLRQQTGAEMALSKPTSPQLIPSVHNIADANRWAEHTWAVVESCCLKSHEHLCGVADQLGRGDVISVSSAFSGIGCAEMAASGALGSLSHFAGRRKLELRVLWAIEENIIIYFYFPFLKLFT